MEAPGHVPSFPSPKSGTAGAPEDVVVVCLTGARIEHVTERIELGVGEGGSIVHIWANNA